MASGPIPGAEAVSQFGAFLGACGEAAVAMVEHVWNGGVLTTTQVDDLVRRLLPAHPDAGSGTTPAELAQLLQQDNLPYAETTVQTGFLEATDQTANGGPPAAPVILEVSQGGKLPGHADTSLQNHYITLLGSDATGYFVGDSDTATGKSGQLIHETQAQIMAANPVAAIGVDPTKLVMQQVNGAGGILVNTATAVPRLAAAVLDILGKATALNWRDVGWRTLLIGFGVVLALIGLAVFVKPTAERGAATAARLAPLAAA